MVYIKRWAEFHAKSVELYKQSPNQTRYVIKATPSQQWLILKVTDDHSCLKFRARSAIIINRFESFTRDMTALMLGLPMPSITALTSSVTATTQSMEIDSESATQTASKQVSSNATTGTGGSSSANKKKKKKGKK